MCYLQWKWSEDPVNSVRVSVVVKIWLNFIKQNYTLIVCHYVIILLLVIILKLLHQIEEQICSSCHTHKNLDFMLQGKLWIPS